MKRLLSSLRGNWRGPVLLLALTLLTGCGGITATKSVSPLDFLLPGLLKNDEPAPLIPDATNTLVALHQTSPTSATR